MNQNKKEKESGSELLVRLSSRSVLSRLDPVVFPSDLDPCQVVELHGESGSGKSAFLLYILTTAILPASVNGVEIGGLNAEVIFVDTMSCFNVARVISVLEQKLAAAPSTLGTGAKNIYSADDGGEQSMGNMAIRTVEEHEIRQCLKKVFVVHCHTSLQLMVTLQSLDNLLIVKPDIRLLLIDSLCTFYHRDKFCSTESHFQAAITQLEKLIQTHGLVVLATTYPLPTGRNRVKRDSRGVQRHLDEDREYFAAWRRLVTLRRTFSKVHSGSELLTNKLCVSFHHEGKELSQMFAVSNEGICYTETS